MKTRKIKETDLFTNVNVFLLDRNKEQLDTLKKNVSMMENVRMDNSALIRGMIEYFIDKPERLREMAPYARNMKGFHILNRFQEMLTENRTLQEVEDELGISIELSNEIKEKLDKKVLQRTDE